MILRGCCLKRTRIIPNKKVANSESTKLDAQLDHVTPDRHGNYVHVGMQHNDKALQTVIDLTTVVIAR